MRDFFIKSFEVLVGAMVILILLSSLVAAAFTIKGSGPFMGLIILVSGTLYAILMGGSLYLFLGIYQNTKKTADLMERFVNRNG